MPKKFRMKKSGVTVPTEKESGRKSWSAFGLVEVVLGMFVLTAALTVVMAPALQSVRYTAENRRIVLATHLAQEGMEVIRNIRDNQFAQAQKDQATLDKAFPDNIKDSKPGICVVQYDDTKLAGANCSINGAKGLKTGLKQNGNGLFVSVASNGSQAFDRRIDIVTNAKKTRYDATVFVTWGGADIQSVNTNNCNRSNRCVFSQTTFTDWNYWSN